MEAVRRRRLEQRLRHNSVLASGSFEKQAAFSLISKAVPRFSAAVSKGLPKFFRRGKAPTRTGPVNPGGRIARPAAPTTQPVIPSIQPAEAVTKPYSRPPKLGRTQVGPRESFSSSRPLTRLPTITTPIHPKAQKAFDLRNARRRAQREGWALTNFGSPKQRRDRIESLAKKRARELGAQGKLIRSTRPGAEKHFGGMRHEVGGDLTWGDIDPTDARMMLERWSRRKTPDMNSVSRQIADYRRARAGGTGARLGPEGTWGGPEWPTAVWVGRKWTPRYVDQGYSPGVREAVQDTLKRREAEAALRRIMERGKL